MLKLEEQHANISGLSTLAALEMHSNEIIDNLPDFPE